MKKFFVPLALTLWVLFLPMVPARASQDVYTDESFVSPGGLDGVEILAGDLRLRIQPEEWTQTTKTDFTEWVENENVVALDPGGVRLMAVGDNWAALENSPFSSPYAIGVTGAGTNVYIIGGYWGGPKVRFARYGPSLGWQELDNSVPFPGGSRRYVRNAVAMVWDGGDCIYMMGGSGYFQDQSSYRDFYRYSIPGESWERLTDTPAWQGPGNAMTRVEDEAGNKFIYAVMGCYPEGYRGNLSEQGLGGKTEFWRFNLQTLDWDERLEIHRCGADDGSSLAWTGGDQIYHLPGAYREGLSPDEKRRLMRYSISEGTWEQLASAPRTEGGGIDDGGSMVWDGGDCLYVVKGGDGPSGQRMGEDFWRYSISNNSWEVLANLPEGVGDHNGPRLAFAGGVYFWRGFGSTGFWRYNPPEYLARGGFTSSGFDSGVESAWQRITWDVSLPHSASIRVWTRSSSDNLTWSGWVESPNGGGLPWENRYLQYRVEFSTAGGATPSLREVRISYISKKPRAGTFTSRVLEFGSIESWGELSWEAVSPDNTSITFSTRSSPDGSAWSDWEELRFGAIQSPARGRPYLQVRVMLQGVGTTTPVLRSYSISYTPDRTREVPAELVAVGATACVIAAGLAWAISRGYTKQGGTAFSGRTPVERCSSALTPTSLRR